MASVAKKTSGRYRLALVNLETKKEIIIACDSLSGKILYAKNQKTPGADLPVLDIYILEHFSDEESLCAYLKKMGYPVTENDVPKFSYQHNGTTNYLELVYNNPVLHDFAYLFREYKRSFENYAYKNGTLKKALRRMISEEIVKDPLWKQFYSDLINQIHDSEFFSYITKTKLLGERATEFIIDYLNNEDGFTNAEKEAFRSAKYYLADTFTAYKPIRGMIISRTHYFNGLYQDLPKVDCSIHKTSKRENNFDEINPWELLTEEQLWYLEDHPTFCVMPKNKQENIILALLGFTNIPWYQRTIQPLTETQIAHLEDHSYFCNLSYLEKIRFVNQWYQSIIEAKSYQKKKV